MRTGFFQSLVFAVAALCMTHACADTITLTPVADTSLFEVAPNNNLGGLTDIPAGAIRVLARARALYRFDLSSIPANATVLSASLSLTVVKKPSGGPGSVFELHRVLSDWGEGTGAGSSTGAGSNDGRLATAGEATWNNRFHPSTPWVAPGGASGTDYDSAASATNFMDNQGPYAFQSTAGLVADVQAWVNQSGANFGWILISSSEVLSQTARRIATREAAFGKPTLVVTFSAPLFVAITNPPNGTSFSKGSDILIQAAASSSGGSITQVNFFANGNLIGSATAAPYSVVFSNAAPGSYALTAVATDSAGGSGTSPAVNIIVQSGNIPPSVAITNPVEGQAFVLGTPVLIEASASDSDGVAQVEFFANGASAGVVTSPPYALQLADLAEGAYVLTAVATDNLGASSTSAPVSISIVAPTEAPTILNQPMSQTNAIGGNAFFSVTVAGTAPFSYQWQFNGADLPTTTTRTLALINVQPANAGPYTVVVTNSAGSITSAPAVLTLTNFVAISSPTNGARFGNNSMIVATADARGTGGITMVEYFLGTNSIGIASNPPFTVIFGPLQAGPKVLTARATDSRNATADSASVVFTIYNPPSIVLTRFPSAASVPLGTNFMLQVTANPGSASLTNVEFFEGTNSIGRVGAPPFSITWQPVQQGCYFLSAVATDDLGQSSTPASNSVVVFVPETVKPTITITSSPPNFARLTNSAIRIAGKASDNQNFDVEFQLNGGVRQFASGTRAWTISTFLVPGTNRIDMRSVDLAGNRSATLTRFFTYVVTVPLMVVAHGLGTFQPNLNNHLLEIGNIYSITARPGAGQLFAGWEGVPTTNLPSLSFQMQSNLMLVANFVPNRFGPVAGTYSGLFFDTNELALASSGYLSLKLSSSGNYSARLAMNGVSYPFSGQFDPSGHVTATVIRRALNPTVFAMQLDLDGATGALTGTVTNAVGTTLLTSDLRAWRNIFSAGSPAPQAGKRTFVLRDAAGGQSVGGGSVKIATSGSTQFSAFSNDGSTFSFASTLSESGESPFYLSLGRGSQAIIGWFEFGTSAGPAVGGQLYSVTAGTNSVLLPEPPGTQ